PRTPHARRRRESAMNLRELLNRVSFEVPGEPARSSQRGTPDDWTRRRPSASPEPLQAEVTGIAYDSRQVSPGAIFVALRGVNADGAKFVPQAIAKGAVAVIAENARPAGSLVPWVQVPNARAALADLAAEYYGNPSGDLALVG